MNLKKITFFGGVVIPIIAWGAMTNLLGGFSALREIVLEQDHWNEPIAIERSSNGEYFVLGESQIEQKRSQWVRKTDKVGSLLWTFRDPNQNGVDAHYESAASSADGGVLACGWEKRWRAGKPYVNSLLILLNQAGQQVHRVDSLFGDESHELVYFKVCARWGEDFVVVGTADLKEHSQDGKFTVRAIAVVVRLRSDGSVIWKKDVDLSQGGPEFPSDKPIAMSNGDIVFRGLSQVARLDQNGNVVSKADLDSGCMPVMGVEDKKKLNFICNVGHADTNAEVVALSDNLRVVRKTPLSALLLGRQKAIALPDGSIAEFGFLNSTTAKFIPTMLVYAPDGTVSGKYQFEGASNQGWIVDGTLAGEVGEVVMVRADGLPNSQTVMTFLKRG